MVVIVKTDRDRPQSFSLPEIPIFNDPNHSIFWKFRPLTVIRGKDSTIGISDPPHLYDMVTSRSPTAKERVTPVETALGVVTTAEASIFVAPDTSYPMEK